MSPGYSLTVYKKNYTQHEGEKHRTEKKDDSSVEIAIVDEDTDGKKDEASKETTTVAKDIKGRKNDTSKEITDAANERTTVDLNTCPDIIVHGSDVANKEATTNKEATDKEPGANEKVAGKKNIMLFLNENVNTSITSVSIYVLDFFLSI